MPNGCSCAYASGMHHFLSYQRCLRVPLLPNLLQEAHPDTLLFSVTPLTIQTCQIHPGHLCWLGASACVTLNSVVGNSPTWISKFMPWIFLQYADAKHYFQHDIAFYSSTIVYSPGL